MKNKTYPKDYTADLLARMTKAGVTRAALARTAELSPSQISRWFNTPMQPSLKNVAVLEAAFAKLTKKGARKRGK